MFSIRAVYVGVACSLISALALAHVEPPRLSPSEHDRLRARLERVFFEQDLMIRNQKVEASDLRHQEKEFEALKVFERIPFQDDLPGLRSSLDDSSRDHGLKIASVRFPHRSHREPAAPPSHLLSDERPSFQLTDQQLVDRIPFVAVVEGSEGDVRSWIRSWPDDQLRLAEADEVQPAPGSANRWRVKAHAYRFREVKFPTLEPREPLELLPAWARKDPETFARAEPQLWSYVERTHAIRSQALPLYHVREHLLLNGARMSFFIARVTPRGDARAARNDRN
jgi:hypothetical protein